MGFRGDDLVSFKLSLNNSSKIAELQELEHWKSKFDVAGAATEGFFSRRWIAKRLFGISDDELLRNQRELYTDRKFDALLEGVGEAIQAEMTGIGGLGEEEALDSELAGDDLDPTADAGLDSPEDLAAGMTATETEDSDIAAPEEDTDSALLAAPGKRDDSQLYQYPNGETTTDNSKGKKYRPRKSDRRKSSGRKRAINSDALPRTKATRTNLFPGAQGILKLARGTLESKETSYNEVEKSILEVSREIKDIVAKLEETRETNENKTQ
tara:strand:- start:111 stop:914 length:804 start_codon:yes stop_codon:yes gene_type:complete